MSTDIPILIVPIVTGRSLDCSPRDRPFSPHCNCCSMWTIVLFGNYIVPNQREHRKRGTNYFPTFPSTLCLSFVLCARTISEDEKVRTRKSTSFSFGSLANVTNRSTRGSRRTKTTAMNVNLAALYSHTYKTK